MAIEQAIKQALSGLNLSGGSQQAQQHASNEAAEEPQAKRRRVNKLAETLRAKNAAGKSKGKGKGKKGQRPDPEDGIDPGPKPSPNATPQNDQPHKRKQQVGDQQVQSKGKGKGKQTQAKLSEPLSGKGKGDAPGAWTTVTRKQPQGEFQLRAQDWSAPLCSYANFPALLEATAGDQVADAVVFATEAEIATIHGILRGTSKKYRVLTIFLSKDEGAQKIPGKIGDHLVFRFAKVTRHVSNGTNGVAPSAKGMQASAFKVKPMGTALVYLRVSKLFASSETWKKFGQRAAKAAVEWIASHHTQSTDTFGWTLEKAKGAKGDGFEQYFGLARIPQKDLDQLLAVSGHEGVFVSAPRQVMPTCALEWVEKLLGETTIAHLERGTRVASLGLALSGGRIAWRKLLGAGEVALRTWQIEDIPASWDHAAVKLLLETNFSELKVLSHRRGKHGEVSFRFRGKACNGNEDRDLVPIIAEFEGANMTLWASLAPSKAPQTQKKPVFTRTVPVIDPEPAPKLDTEQRLATAQQGVNEDGKLEGDKKRVPQQVRKLPKTLKLEVGKKDGNCMLHALSIGLAFLEIKRSAHPAQLRAELAAHMRKHGEKYKKQWDGLDSRGAPASDFETYVNEVEKDGAFLGELEVAALARILDIRIVVLPE